MYHRAIGCTPLEMVGESCCFKIDNEYGIKLVLDQEKILRKADSKLRKYQEEYGRAKKDPESELKVGDTVWYADPNKLTGKLSPIWTRKARILKKATNSYELIDGQGKIWLSNQRLVKRRL